MRVDKVKQQALEYANKYAKDEDAPFDFDVSDYSPQEWFLVIMLAQVYYNVMKGIYTRDKGQKEQKRYFEYVNQNPQLFEYYCE